MLHYVYSLMSVFINRRNVQILVTKLLPSNIKLCLKAEGSCWLLRYYFQKIHKNSFPHQGFPQTRHTRIVESNFSDSKVKTTAAYFRWQLQMEHLPHTCLYLRNPIHTVLSTLTKYKVFTTNHYWENEYHRFIIK